MDKIKKLKEVEKVPVRKERDTIEVLTSINGNMNRFFRDIKTALKDVEFEDSEKLQEGLKRQLAGVGI